MAPSFIAVAMSRVNASRSVPRGRANPCLLLVAPVSVGMYRICGPLGSLQSLGFQPTLDGALSAMVPAALADSTNCPARGEMTGRTSGPVAWLNCAATAPRSLAWRTHSAGSVPITRMMFTGCLLMEFVPGRNRRLGRDQPRADRRRFGAVSHPKFVKDPGDMHGHGAFADEQRSP